MAEKVTLQSLELDVTSTNKGVARRLLDGRLRPPEQQYLASVEQIAQLEDEGLSFATIAEAIGWETHKIYSFVATEKYRVFRKYIADRALFTTDAQAGDRRRAERRRWDANGGRALDYYDAAFRRHTQDDDSPKPKYKRGDFMDLDRAERAAQLFARSAGWTDPVPTHVKPKDLKVGVIQQAMRAIAAADRKETVVRITETIEIGSRSETAPMGGEA